MTKLIHDWMVTRGGAKLNLLTEVTQIFCLPKKFFFAQCEDIPGSSLRSTCISIKVVKYCDEQLLPRTVLVKEVIIRVTDTF